MVQLFVHFAISGTIVVQFHKHDNFKIVEVAPYNFHYNLFSVSRKHVRSLNKYVNVAKLLSNACSTKNKILFISFGFFFSSGSVT